MGETGSTPGVHPKGNSSKDGQCAGLKIRRYRFESCLFHNRSIVQLDRTLGYEPRNASSSLATPTKIKEILATHNHCVVMFQFCGVIRKYLFSLKGRAVVKDIDCSHGVIGRCC